MLSDEQLSAPSVKQLTSASFLKEIKDQYFKLETRKILAIVESKKAQDKNFISIKVSTIHSDFLLPMLRPETDKSPSSYNIKMWVNYFDSMSTRIREFRTIKGAEFFNGSNLILNPS